MLKRVYLNDMREMINKKDIRSIRKWCAMNNLNIYKDMTGEYTFQSEFELAYHLPLIKRLQKDYGDDWQTVFDAYKDGNVYSLLDFTNNGSSSYKPSGSITSKLMNRIN
jgi:hypothetical protein